MFKLIILLSFFAIDLGAFKPFDDKEGNPIIHGYIVGGNDTDIKDVPYQISLHIGTRFVCGGSIISPTHILTAAHCVSDFAIYANKKLTYNIRAGSSFDKKGGVFVPVKKVVYHPKYSEATTDYDVAVAELSTALTYSDKIQAIKLPKKTAPDGEMVLASGWGCLKENCERSVTLQSVRIPMVNRKTCETNYKKYLKITPRMICAGVEGKDACQGDSGGPLAYGKFLVGITSTGVGCGRKDFPGIYTNIVDPEVREFIKKHSNV